MPIAASGQWPGLADIQAAIVEGAQKRLCPKFMTVATMFVGLIPIIWASGTGSDVLKRIGAPPLVAFRLLSDSFIANWAVQNPPIGASGRRLPLVASRDCQPNFRRVLSLEIKEFPQ